MPFTAHDLRYKAEETYPALYAHLSHQAQRFLGSLKLDAFELDLVVGHVVVQLVQMGLLGCGDKTPLTALDRLNNAQFYAFLNRSIRNKAIDRLRKHRLHMSSTAELKALQGMEGEDDPLNEVVEPLWGPVPFATPEDATLALASQQELRNVLVHCIKELSVAPHQLQAILQELEEFDAAALLHDVIEELKDEDPVIEKPIAHVSQHKDHAHKKLRHCLQEKSSNLAVVIALRLTTYGVRSATSDEFTVLIHTLAQEDLSEGDVRTGLSTLVDERSLYWDGDEVVHITSAQMRRLMRFYKEDE